MAWTKVVVRDMERWICLGYVLEVQLTNPAEFIFWETKEIVVQFTESDRNGLNWLRMTVKQKFSLGMVSKLGTHKWQCEVSSVILEF